MSPEEFEEYYPIKTNFLEFGKVKIMLKEFLTHKEIPLYNEKNPENCMINMIVSGISNMYRGIHGRTSHILTNICAKWDEKADIRLNITDVSRSFIRTHKLCDEVYSKFIQFRNYITGFSQLINE